MIKSIKKLFQKILNFFKNFSINREKLGVMISYFLPEYWAKNRKSYILFWFIGSFTVIFLIWASLAEVNQVVRATGILVPDSKVHLVQSGVPGPVEGINVSLDDKVEAGDILFLIDTESRKEFFELTNKSIIHAFIPHVNKSESELRRISQNTFLITQIIYYSEFLHVN